MEFVHILDKGYVRAKGTRNLLFNIIKYCKAAAAGIDEF